MIVGPVFTVFTDQQRICITARAVHEYFFSAYTPLLRPASTLQIAPCTKTYEHEWSTCPYVHEGEKMRRRDPRTHSCHACPLSKQKKPCPLGDACQHAHNVYECGFHPDR